jgi:hypothetical protein
MIKYNEENEKWEFLSKKVILNDNGTEITKYTDDINYYNILVERNQNILLVSTEDLIPTTEQEKRLNNLNLIQTDPNFQATYSNYVKNSTLPEGYEGILKDLKIKEEQDSLDTDISDLLFELIDKGVL